MACHAQDKSTGFGDNGCYCIDNGDDDDDDDYDDDQQLYSPPKLSP